MKQTYRGWRKCIRNDTNDKTIEVEIEIEGWSMQWPESLLYLIRKLELDK